MELTTQGSFFDPFFDFCENPLLLVKIDSLIFSKPSLPPTHQGSMYVWALALKKDGFLLLLTASLMGFDLQTKPITQ
jgi:hypothetical protein